MVCAQPRIYVRVWDAHNSMGFWDTNKSLEDPDQVIFNKREEPAV